MRNFSLYKLRNSPLPSKANPSNEVIHELQECFKEVLSLCDELNDDSIELYSMRIMATQLLHYLSSSGVRAKDMLAATRKFRAGKWEQLWNESIKTADKIRLRKAESQTRLACALRGGEHLHGPEGCAHDCVGGNGAEKGFEPLTDEK